MEDHRPTLDRRNPQRLSSRAPNYAPPELVTSISEHVRRVCGDWPDSEFRALVQTMAHIEWKYDQRRREDTFRSER
jgi:hypothetical protein